MLYYKIPIVDGVFDYPTGCLLCCGYPLYGYYYCKFEACPEVGPDWVQITAEEFNANCPEFTIMDGDPLEPVHVTANKTLDAVDANRFLSVDAAATITIPADVLPVGAELEVFRNTSEAVTIAAFGVSFSIPGNAELVMENQTISDQYASIVLKHIADNVWSIQGAI